MRGRMRNNRNRRRPRRTQNGIPRAPNVSNRDMTVQTRTFMEYNQLAFTNQQGDFSYGLTSFNVTPKDNTYIGQILSSYSDLYEEYKISRCIIKAQCGKGYTNDDRIKTILVSRVDVDNQNTTQDFQTFRALANASNAKTRTLTERGNVVLCDFRPIMFDNVFTTNAVVPLLPSKLQWNRIAVKNYHQWRGAVLAVAIPDTNIMPDSMKITLTMQYTIQFRGRVNQTKGLTASPDVPTLNPPSYDMEITEDDLRNNLLSGLWFPININHSIGNIGHTVTGDMLLHESFRVQSSGEVYVIEATESPKLFCNLVV